MLFWWFSVGLRKYDCSFVLEISLLNRSSISADCGALAFSPTPSLMARSWRGTGVHPREDNALGLVASLQSREQYRLAVYTPPV